MPPLALTRSALAVTSRVRDRDRLLEVEFVERTSGRVRVYSVWLLERASREEVQRSDLTRIVSKIHSSLDDEGVAADRGTPKDESALCS